jgi:hypothetical protein
LSLSGYSNCCLMRASPTAVQPLGAGAPGAYMTKHTLCCAANLVCAVQQTCMCSTQLSKASMGPPASAIASLGGGRLFLGSWVGDSLLVSATRQQTKVRRRRGSKGSTFNNAVLVLLETSLLVSATWQQTKAQRAVLNRMTAPPLTCNRAMQPRSFLGWYDRSRACTSFNGVIGVVLVQFLSFFPSFHPPVEHAELFSCHGCRRHCCSWVPRRPQSMARTLQPRPVMRTQTALQQSGSGWMAAMPTVMHRWGRHLLTSALPGTSPAVLCLQLQLHHAGHFAVRASHVDALCDAVVTGLPYSDLCARKSGFALCLACAL